MDNQSLGTQILSCAATGVEKSLLVALRAYVQDVQHIARADSQITKSWLAIQWRPSCRLTLPDMQQTFLKGLAAG